MRAVEQWALGAQKPQVVVQTAYNVITPLSDDRVSTEEGLVALALALQIASNATGVGIGEVLQVARNMLAEAGSSLRTENTEHVRALKLFIEGEL